MNNKKGWGLALILMSLGIIFILGIGFFIIHLKDNSLSEQAAKRDCQSLGLEFVDYDFDNEVVNCRNNTDYIITENHKIRVVE